ncbi:MULTISPECIES: ESPR-type extended signal peptide-containing protein [Burkholderia]|uniref:ESPR-type extended signal peptide-containing protein n=1 Tax=Burkholderia TaxID=32008 RepID=UPI00047F4163|nr:MULTISPECIES: ESPR-type extended signal peptide-containing protein [Burkholderia]
MNKTHRTIFNTVTGTWVAASEFATSRKKSGGQRALVRSAIALAAMLLGLGAPQAFADSTDAGACTTVDGRNGTLGETGACNASSIGSIGTMAALDDTYVKVSGTTAAIGSGENSVAIGNSAQALTKDATAVGSGTLATGTSSAAFGAFASASGTSSAAFGASASATGTSSSAFGSFSTASGLGSVATGRYANANGDYTTALGNSALAGTTYATAVGTSATASGISASAFGSSATASGSGAVAVGRLATASGTGALALGNAVSATGNYTTVVGNTAKASVAGAVALGYNANASASNAVAIGTNSVADKADTISVGSTAVQRKIVNVEAGDVSASSTDVVNGSQLYATNQQIAQNTADITHMDGRVTANGTSITELQTQIGEGTVGLVQQDATTRIITVAAGLDGAMVNFAGTAGERRLTGIANGDVEAGSTDAITGDQLYATNQDVAKNTSDIAKLGDNVTQLGSDVTNIDGRVTQNETNIAQNAADITTINSKLGSAITDDYVKINTVAAPAKAAAGSIAIGGAAEATSTYAVAIGHSATVSGTNAIALGVSATASGESSTALGKGTIATGLRSSAVGVSATASGHDSVALGANSVADRDSTVSVGSSALQRQITNMAAGTEATDAVNVSQLSPVVEALGGGASIDLVTGAVTGPTYNLANGGTKTTVGEALDGLDQALTTANGNIAKNTSDIANLGSNVTQLGSDVTNLGTQVTSIDGRVTQNETNIANLGDNVTQLGSDVANLGTQVTNIDGRVTVNEGDIKALADQIGSGTTGLVQQAGAGADLTVGANTDGAAVNFTGTAGERKLTGLANGDVAAGSTDAVTGDQLHATNQDVAKNASDIANLGSNVTQLGSDVMNLGTQVTSIDGRVAINEGDIKALADQIGSGTTGLVQQDATTRDITVAKGTDGATVDFAGTAGERKLTGLANGDVAAGSTDAVTGDQLHATNQDVAKNTSDIADLGSNVTQLGSDVSNLNTQVTNIDGRVTQNTTNIAKNTTDITTINDQLADLSSGTIGLVQQTAAGADLTVGANTDGAAVNFAGTAGERKLTGLANGDVAAGSTDAVTGDQLHTVGVNVSNLDQRVTNNETSITQIRSDMNSGSIGLVQQSAAGADLMVGANTDGAAVNFAGTAGERKLTGIANGDVAAGSVDAVTGDQLYATNQAVAQNASDISDNRTEITNINSQLASGQIGLVQQDRTTGAITVAASTGGTSVNFAGTGGARTLSGVANGVKDDDAVTIAQLKATGLIDYTGKELGAVVYDGVDLDHVTFGGSGGTWLHNVAPGLIASGSMDAVNGGQLFAMQQDFENRFSGLGDRVSDLEAGGGSGGPGGPGNGSGDFDPSGSGEGSVQLGPEADAAGSNSTAIGNGASASAGGSTAIGQGSLASGNNGTAIGHGSNASGAGSTALGQGSNSSGSGSTAVGQNANASGNNSVALGAGSVADRDNAVSVGSAGAERQITNVAAGTAPTDAVNVQQMNNAARSARQDAMGGVAAAMAVAGLPQSTLPGRTFVAMAGSTYGGEYGSALGVSYMTRDGKWTIKASANTSSRGEVGAVVGGGFYW